jgi:hypothetical protein
MGNVGLLALAAGWLACTVIASRIPGLLGYWAVLCAALAGSTLAMHVPAVVAATHTLAAADVHLLAVAVAVPGALPAAGLQLRARVRRRPASGEVLVGRPTPRVTVAAAATERERRRPLVATTR